MQAERECLQCTTKFVPNKMYHLFCTKRCCDAFNRQKTWKAFFRTLLNNNAANRQELTVDFLDQLYKKQKGKCALSGVQLTKITGHGVVSTNASIDRINPGSEYTKENVRLVCRFINCFRSDVSDTDFIWWCRKVAKYNG